MVLPMPGHSTCYPHPGFDKSNPTQYPHSVMSSDPRSSSRLCWVKHVHISVFRGCPKNEAADSSRLEGRNQCRRASDKRIYIGVWGYRFWGCRGLGFWSSNGFGFGGSWGFSSNWGPRVRRNNKKGTSPQGVMQLYFRRVSAMPRQQC